MVDQVLRPASRDERIVKIRVLRFPGIGVAIAFYAAESVCCSENTRLPIPVSLDDRCPNCQGLRPYPRLGDVEQLGNGYLRNVEALLPFGHHQAAGGEPGQGFAQRTCTDFVTIPKPLDTQLFAGRKPAAQDVLPKAGIGSFRQGRARDGNLARRCAEDFHNQRGAAVDAFRAANTLGSVARCATIAF